MSKKLVVCFHENPIANLLVARIDRAWREANSPVEIINVGQAELANVLCDADFFCGHAKISQDWKRIVAAGKLQWIQSSAAGMDWCLVPPVIESKIEITTASGALADQVAEHTLGLILAWLRRLPLFFQDQQQNKNFVRRATFDLTESTVGIIGFGGVGRRLAELLQPFRCRIRACDLFPNEKPKFVESLENIDAIPQLLSQSDIVVLALPLNSETESLIDENMLRLMKRSAILVNVARGKIIKTAALLDALQNGIIAGAAIDVADPEPLPPNHPLWDTPNLIITPHVAGQSRFRFETIVELFCENIRRRFAREPLVNFLSREGKRLGFPLRGETPLWIDVRSSLSAR